MLTRYQYESTSTSIVCLLCMYLFDIILDVTVSFEQPALSVDENNGPVQLVLFLSTPSSFVINVQVRAVDNTAMG